MRILALALAALLLAVPAAEAKKKPSKRCTRGGASLQAADGHVRVVRKKQKLTDNRTRSVAVMACWSTTGKRTTILLEEDIGEDLVTGSRVEIVDERYVGVIASYVGGVSESRSAEVWDARTRRRLHTTTACAGERGDFSGPDDVVFLGKGGMAFSCGPLWLFRNATAADPEQLEPPEANVGALAVSRHSFSFIDRLYWSRGDGTAKSLDLM